MFKQNDGSVTGISAFSDMLSRLWTPPRDMPFSTRLIAGAGGVGGAPGQAGTPIPILYSPTGFARGYSLRGRSANSRTSGQWSLSSQAAAS